MQKPENEGPACSYTPLKRDFSPAQAEERPFDQIIIAGGGLAAIFTAYEILKKAQDAGKKIEVLLLAEKLSAPCTAGSHVVLELDGLFGDDVPNRPAIRALLEDGLSNLEQTIAREKIDCRYRRGYEIKGVRHDEFKALIDEMIGKGIYKTEEIKMNSGDQVFNLPGHAHSVTLDAIGQVNMPELIEGLTKRIQEMGACMVTGARYESHSMDDTGIYTVHTDIGDFKTYSKPLLATGAEHQKSLPGFEKIKCQVVHTMGLVMGPLSEQDAAKISKGPMAVCNTELHSDVLWGGIDEHRVLTLGRGDLVSPTEEDIDDLHFDITAQIESFYPGITKIYPPVISFGPMLIAENRMPIVGRMRDYDVAGGWAGMGVVAGYAAARAYADWVVNGNDEKLKLFESMQPGFFQPEFEPSVRTDLDRPATNSL